MSVLTLKVNGQTHTLDVDPATPLLYVLSDDLGLRGPKFGCGLGQCGACTVIVKGQAVRSCVTPVKTVQGVGDHHARRPRHDREAAPDSEGVHRRAGRAVRLLPERRDPDRQGFPRQESESQRRRDSAGACPACCAAASRTCACCAAIETRAAGDGAMKTRISLETRPRWTTALRRQALARAGFSRRDVSCKGSWRADRQLQHGRTRWSARMRSKRARGAVRRRMRSRLSAARSTRFLDRHRRRRQRDRLHRQGRARARESPPRKRSWWPRSFACRSIASS